MKINFRNLFAYLFTVAVSVLFLLFLDGQGGSYLIIALVLGLILSFSIFIWTYKTVMAELNVSEDILNKGDNIKATLVLRKKGLLPTSLIKFNFSNTVHFTSEENKSLCLIIFAQDVYSVERSFRSVFFGNGKVGTNEIIISDYFGIFTFKINNTDLYRTVKIYPDIPEISNRDNFARSLTDAATFDDSEDTTHNATSFNGVPGYEHRPYIPGDNLKLINWKLSAKRRELLVRQLEGTGGAEQLFILIRDDLYFEECQLAAEAMLGIMMIFAKAEIPARAVIYIDDNWEEICVNNPSDLFQLRYRMTDYYLFPLKNYCETNKIKEANELRKIALPDKADGDSAVIFAPASDENLTAFLEKLSNAGTEYQAAVCVGDAYDKRIRRIERDNLSVRFSD